MLHVGLTGNIATGKSNASHVFAGLGAHIIDADVIARNLLSPGTATYDLVVNAFGPEILNPDRTVNRKLLGAIIFGDASKRVALNTLIHPEVRREVLRQIAELEKDSAAGVIIVDAALMVESGFYKMYDRLVVVRCEPAIQLARIVNRDGLSVEEARLRMAAQLPSEEKVKVAHYVIDTSGTLGETRDQIEGVYRDLVGLEARLRNFPEA